LQAENDASRSPAGASLRSWKVLQVAPSNETPLRRKDLQFSPHENLPNSDLGTAIFLLYNSDLPTLKYLGLPNLSGDLAAA
jgi:hypothetical protein